MCVLMDLILNRMMAVWNEGQLLDMLRHIVVPMLCRHIRLGGVVLTLLVKGHHVGPAGSVALGSGGSVACERATV